MTIWQSAKSKARLLSKSSSKFFYFSYFFHPCQNNLIYSWIPEIFIYIYTLAFKTFLRF